MASRSDGDDGLNPEHDPPEGGKRKRFSFHRSVHPDESDGGAEFTINVRFGYKTILLVIVTFDVARRVIGQAITNDWLGILPD